MKTSRLVAGFGIWLLLVLPSAAQQPQGDPAWMNSDREILNIFDPSSVTQGMRASLDRFAAAFTLCGVAAVIIGSVRRVAKSRGGEESMGWVSGMVITVALMASGPRLGDGLFTAGCR